MNNLKEARKKNNLTQAEVASIIGITQNAYSYWESGKVKMDNASLNKLANHYQVSVDYLLGRDPIPSQKKRGVKIPVLGIIPAGMPIEAIEDIIDYEEVSEELAKTGEFFGLKVKGNSMTPDIKNDDVLIVRKQETFNNNEICVVLVNGYDATVKKLKQESSGIWLIPNNPEFEAQFYPNEKINSLPVKVIGRVIEIRRTL